MAKYDPVLQQSSAKPFISPGVASPSWGGVISDLVDTGMKTYEAVKTTDLWEKMQGDITGYLQNQTDAVNGTPVSQEALDAKTEFGGQVAAENAYWERAEGKDSFGNMSGNALVGWDEVDAVQRNMTQTFDKFVRAQEAGRMSVNELQTRIQSTVKTAAANNPLIQDQLIQQAQKYMEVTGASSWMKAKLSLEEKAAKQEDDLYKQDEAWAKEFGVSMTRPTWREEAREQAVLSRNHTLGNNKMDEMIKKKQISKMQLSEIVNDPMQRQKWMKGALGTIHQTYMHSSNLPGLKANDVLMHTTTAINGQITFVNSLMAYLPPDERVSLQGEVKLLEEQRAIYKDLIEGGPNATSAQNRLAYAQALAKLPNVSANEAADMLTKITSIHKNIYEMTGELPWGVDLTSQLGDKGQILKYMQQMQSGVDNYTTPVINVNTLGNPAGKEAVQIASSLVSPNSHPEALRINSQSIDKFLDHVASIKDPDAATQAADVYVKQMVDSAKAANMPIGKMLDALTLAKLNTHLGSLMGSFRSGTGQVDYDPQLNTFSYLNEDGSVNRVASERANMIFKAVVSANGFTEEDTIDKWASSVSANAMKSTPKQAWYARTPADAFDLFEKGTIDEAEYMELIKMMKGQATTSGAYPSGVTTSPDPSIPVVTSKALLEPETVQQTTPVGAPVSKQFVKDLKSGTKASISPQEESTNKALEALKNFNKVPKGSPLMKRSPAEDAIVASDATEAVVEALSQVHPAAGMAATAALIAFGGVTGAPALAKLMPKLLKPAGKVITGSNVTLAGGNVGANKAIVSSILATAEKTKKTKMENLYKEYWNTGWQKDRVELPKTDAEWSQAIAQANEYVARKLNPDMLKTMKGK